MKSQPEDHNETCPARTGKPVCTCAILGDLVKQDRDDLAMKNIDVQVGAVYRIQNLCSQGGFRVYRCTGNYPGAQGQEDNVGFEALDKTSNGEILVPRAMLWVMEKLERVGG